MDTMVTEGSRPDPNDIWVERQRALRRGRALHAEALSGALRRVARAVVSVIGRGIAVPLRRALRRRGDGLALLSMSDHMLADLGLMRADVQAMAYGVVPAARVSGAPERPERAFSGVVIELAAERMMSVTARRVREAA